MASLTQSTIINPKKRTMENKTLRQFINEFISTSDRLRKTNYTNISYISDTINRVFRKYYGAEDKFNPEIIIETFKALNFRQVEDKNQKWGGSDSPMNLQETVWTNIDTKDLRILRLTLAKLPVNTDNKKREKVNELTERLRTFNPDRTIVAT